MGQPRSHAAKGTRSQRASRDEIINRFREGAFSLSEAWENVWTGGLPHLSVLPHLPGVPYLHVNRPLIWV